MARLVFLAVLLAAATYASADETTTTTAAAAKELRISTCTKGDADKCEDCKKDTTADFTADGACGKTGETGKEVYYKATCKADNGGWTLELFSEMGCSGNAAHTIDPAGKCFDSKTTIIAKVTSISDAAGAAEADKVHTVKANVCPPAATARACKDVKPDATTPANGCPEQTLMVKQGAEGTKCAELPNKIKEDDTTKYYYSAVVKEETTPAGRAMRQQNEATPTRKLSLWLYTTQETCKAKVPVFVGEDMEVKAASETTDNSCKMYQQKLNAELCGVPPTAAPATTNETTAPESGSAAVSAVLALLAAACAVWMM